MDQAGQPGKESLRVHKDINFLQNFIIPIDPRKSSLISVDVKQICRKGILVETDSCKYIIVQPNVYERH